MYVFLGGKRSNTINRLAHVISTRHAVRVAVVSTSELEENAYEILRGFPDNTKFILSFSNKSNKLEKRLRSSNLLRKILVTLKSISVLDENIILLGSNSHLGVDFEKYHTLVKYGLLRDPYAFDCVSKFLVTKEIFPNFSFINIPGLKRDRNIVSKYTRKIIIWFVAKIHSIDFAPNIEEMDLEEICCKIVSLDKISHDNYLNIKYKIGLSGILHYTPVSLLKFHASVIAYNKINTPKVISSDGYFLSVPKYQFYIVTPLNIIDENFWITFENVTSILKVLQIEWVICVSEKIYKDVYEIVKNIDRVTVETERYPSLYGGYNAFLRSFEFSNGYYIPLSAGDILFTSGLMAAISHCQKTDDLIVFGNVLKHGKYVNMRILGRGHFNLGTHRLVTGHSAACLIKIEAHQAYGTYDISYRLAADNDFFEKVRTGSKDRIGVIDETLGYFPPGGISQNNYLESYIELFRSRIENNYPVILEAIFLFIRILRVK